MDWPPILEPGLLERMAFAPAEFDAHLDLFIDGYLEAFFTPAFARSGIDYPFERPAGSFVLDGAGVRELSPADDEILSQLGAGDTAATPSPRYPLLAIGANGSPETLTRKLSVLSEPEDRRVIALAGELHDFDIGPISRMTAYGAFAATPIASPGTIVRCSVLWVTAAAFTALTASEISYHVGRLNPIRFIAQHREIRHELTYAYVYVSRWGNLWVDGEPVALAALPAERRQAPALTQHQLLERAARATLGRLHTADDLIERLIESPRVILREVGLAMARDARPFSHPAWTAYPGTNETL